HSFLALDAQADQRADLAADLDRLLLGEVAEVLHLQLAVGVLVDDQRVDDAYGAAFAEPLQLGDDLTVEVGLTKPDHDELHRSDCHALAFPDQLRCLAASIPPTAQAADHPFRTICRTC